jgi:hypothetical protein
MRYPVIRLIPEAPELQPDDQMLPGNPLPLEINTDTITSGFFGYFLFLVNFVNVLTGGKKHHR